MNKKDKGILRDIVRQELESALCREITVERGPRKNGDPEKTLDMVRGSVLDFLAEYLPRIEGALRGLQADINRTNNRVTGQVKKIDLLGQTLVDLEQPIRQISGFSDELRRLGFNADGLKLIEGGQE